MFCTLSYKKPLAPISQKTIFLYENGYIFLIDYHWDHENWSPYADEIFILFLLVWQLLYFDYIFPWGQNKMATLLQKIFLNIL